MESESSGQAFLADRLNSNRRRLFVGRQAEKAALEAFATAPQDASGLVAHLCAAGGVGKTTLMKTFIQDTAYDSPILWLDARDIPPDPAALAGAIAAMRNHRGLEDGDPHLLIIDTFERLAPLEAWIREAFMPAQTTGFRLILAGRTDPALEWRTDPVWIGEHRYWTLDSFSAQETREYLTLRGLTEDSFERAHQFARGNPLALALFTDSTGQDDETALGNGGDTGNNLTRSWHRRLITSLDNPEQQAALEACCVVRQLDAPMLASMLERDQADALFQWLRSQSYIEAGVGGLFPHDLLRQAFTEDLKQREPAHLVRLGDRAFATIHDRLANAVGDRLGLIQDAFFLLRDVDVQQHAADPNETAVYVDRARQSDWPAIDDMVRRYENSGAVTLLHQLHAAQPEAFRVVRDAIGNALGFFQILRVDLLPETCLSADPVCAHFLNMARKSLDHKGTVILNRFWLHRDHDMSASAVYTQAFSHLAFMSVSAAPAVMGSHQGDTPEWRRASARFGHHEACIDTTARNGRPSMFIYQDLTANAKAGIDWLRQAYRYAHGLEEPLAKHESGRQELPDQAAFQRALRQAFRHATRLDRLQGNELLDCRLLVRPDTNDDPLTRARQLQASLAETCDRLEAVTTTRPHAQVLQATYLRPAPSQQAAAERLALSYATYRRRLTEALKLVEAEWWSEELALRDN